MALFESLVRVEALSITFLVDNSIEWFHKWPPGFKLEIRNHLSNGPPIDDLTGLPIVDLENYCCGAHGFSAVIETTVNGHKSTTLFDTGPDSKSIIRNIKSLKLENQIRDLGHVILSHWHSDHSGGMLSMLDLRKSLQPEKAVIIDLHPDRPIARGIAPPPTFTHVIGRIPEDPSFEAIETAGGKVEQHDEGHTVADGTVFVSGEIPRIVDFEAGLLGGMRWFKDPEGGGTWKAENHIMDERYAVVDVIGKGLVIFSACSHAGVVNVVRDAIKQFSRPVHMIVGGFHLGAPELQVRIPPTVAFLAHAMRPAPTYVLPMHCSGFATKVALEKEFGQGCVPAGSGMQYEVQGDKELDDGLKVSIE